MPANITSKRQLKGIYSNLNHSSGIPEGGVLEADNCVVERPGLLSKRKGFNRYGDELTGSVKSLMDFDGFLVAYDGATMSCDAAGDGTLVTWDGQFAPPDTVHAIRGATLKKNLYFTSAQGIYRNDSRTGTPDLAGVPTGLDIDIETYGIGDGWLPHDTQISYRVVWSREDANDSVMVSEPSPRRTFRNVKTPVTLIPDGEGSIVVTHTDHPFSTGDIVTVSDSVVIEYEGVGKEITKITDDSYSFEFSVDLGNSLASVGKDYFIKLIFTIPDGIISGDKYEIFRTAVSAGQNVDPGDEHMSVVKKEVTAAELTQGLVEYSDTTLEIVLGASLYTNSFQETTSQANSRPPLCKDVVEFRGHLFASDLTYNHEKEIQLSEVEDLALDDSISIRFGDAVLTYKIAFQENPNERTFVLSSDDDSTQLDIEATTRSLVRVINRDPNNSFLYAHYVSGAEDPSGKVLLRARKLQQSAFSVTASSSAVGESFEEEIPTSGESFISKAQNIPNGLIYSKTLEPDAFPSINLVKVGTEGLPIQRIFSLKSSLVILKEDGAYRLTGNTPATFVLQPLDPAVSIQCPNAAVKLNDSIYCLATQGILKIGENGTTIVSYAIEDQIKNINSYSDANKISFAVANEESRRVIVFTQKTSGDRWAKKGWVYNYLTKDWTTWTKDVNCGISLKGKRDMYLGHARDNFVLKERSGISQRNSSDYSDEDIPVTLTAVSGTTVTFTYDYRVPMRAGFLLNDGIHSAKIKSITSITDAYRAPYTVEAVLERVLKAPRKNPAGTQTSVQDALDLDDGLPRSLTVSLPIDSVIKWAPNNLGSSEHPKQFTYAMITMESGTTLTNELGFYSDAVPASEWVGPIVLNTPEGWGQGKWGSQAWGSEEVLAVVPLTSPVPRQHQRCRELTVMFRHRVAKEEFDIESVALRYKAYKGKLVRAPE